MTAARKSGPRATRRLPSQERARATVKALLDATAKVLVEEGFERATTNRIAVVAGVSIGSLYQYFPSKEELIVALAERHVGEMTGLIGATIAELEAVPLEQAARRLVQAIVAAHRVSPDLHRVLEEQVPRIGQFERLAGFEGPVCKLVEAALHRRRSELAPTDLGVAAFCLTHAVEGVVHAFLMTEARHEAARAEALIEELTALVLGYLRPRNA